MDDNTLHLDEPRVETRPDAAEEEQRIPEATDDIHETTAPDRLADGNYVGEDNIREGRVGGVIGGTHQQGGEGQGG